MTDAQKARVILRLQNALLKHSPTMDAGLARDTAEKLARVAHAVWFAAPPEISATLTPAYRVAAQHDLLLAQEKAFLKEGVAAAIRALSNKPPKRPVSIW